MIIDVWGKYGRKLWRVSNFGKVKMYKEGCGHCRGGGGRDNGREAKKGYIIWLMIHKVLEAWTYILLTPGTFLTFYPGY